VLVVLVVVVAVVMVMMVVVFLRQAGSSIRLQLLYIKAIV
jgi:hypothetical protein